MASGRITPQTLAQLHLNEEEHPRWTDAFEESTRCAQIEDDLFAARSVSGVLIAIVTGGALLGVLGVVLALLV